MTAAELAALANEAAGATDYTATTSGGGDFERELPPAGKTLIRFREYIELGLHSQASKLYPNKKPAQKARFVFEIVHPKHIKVIQKDGGEEMRIAHTVSCTLSVGNNEKANFIKLFKQLNYDGKAKHPAQLLGRGYIAEIVHGFDKADLDGSGKPKDGAKPKYANIQKDGVYTITAPRVEDPLEGTVKEIPVPEAMNPLKLFLYSKPTKATWDSLFIDGTREKDGKTISKNWIQEEIQKALDYEGSALFALLHGGKTLEDLPTSEAAAKNVADPLAGIGAFNPDDDIPF